MATLPVWLIYTRKSVVQNEEDLESPERQVYICERYLEFTETEPYRTEIYQDLDVSGASEKGRNDWLKVKERISSPEVKGVIAASLSRMYRNVLEALQFRELLSRHNKKLKSVQENIDTTTVMGRAMFVNIMNYYQMESENTGQRMRDMIHYKRHNQGRHWGTAPFGTSRAGKGEATKGQLVASDETYQLDSGPRYYFDALTECFRLYALGTMSYDDVALSLNLNGWRFWETHVEKRGERGQRYPAEWNSERVRSVLNRWRIYRGDLPLGDPRKNPHVEWLPGGHQPILPVELCDAVSVVLTERSKRLWNRRGNDRRIYLLSDVAYCTCGMKLIGNYQRCRLYRHSRGKGECPEIWIEADSLENQVLAAATEFATHPAIISDLRQMIATMDTPCQDNSTRIAVIKNQLTRLEDLYLTEGGISKETYLTRRHTLLTELSNLQPITTSPSLNDVSDKIITGLHSLTLAEPKTQKALVNEMFQRLTVSHGKIISLIPQVWAEPFFSACSKWAGWESNPDNTPAIILWFTTASKVSGW